MRSRNVWGYTADNVYGICLRNAAPQLPNHRICDKRQLALLTPPSDRFWLPAKLATANQWMTRSEAISECPASLGEQLPVITH